MNRLIILPQFYKSFKTRCTSPLFQRRVQEKLKRLQDSFDEGREIEYLNRSQGKPLTGNLEHIFKFKISDGDRICYTLGKFIKGLDEKYSNSMFIFSYSSHDDQGRAKLPNITEDDITIEHADREDIQDCPDIDEIVNNFNSYSKTHSQYVLDIDNFCDTFDNADVLLSPEQDEIINDYLKNPTNPLLLLGGAGTGKTIMALHILNDFVHVNPNAKCIYFTQSETLRQKAADRFKYLVGNNNSNCNVEFKNITDFCEEKYNKYHENDKIKGEPFTEYDFSQFIKHMDLEDNLRKLNINIYDLWAEIRGTIKGSLNENWTRPHIYESIFSNNFLKDVIYKNQNDNDIVTYINNTNKFYINNIKECKKRITVKDDSCYLKDIKLLKKDLNEVDFNSPLISKENYNSIKAEDTTLPDSNRDTYYEIANKYQKYLIEESKFDDNDLVMKLLSCSTEDDKYDKENNNKDYNPEDKYDFIVIDEIQDYTELQIYAILQYAKSYNSIVMAGDDHQIINPTMFRVSRLMKYFYYKTNNTTKLITKTIKRNFRCPQNIVEIANKMNQLSIQLIGAQDKRDEEFSRFSTHCPFILKYEDNNIKNLIDKLLLCADAAILVANQEEKEKLITFYDQNSKEKYEKSNNPIIYTVSEIKGMEYKYVVSFNLINTYNKEWTTILSSNNQVYQQTRYRYYFNLFYVAITRSQQYLCFVEHNYKNDLFNKLFDFNITNGKEYKLVEEFDEDQLEINSSNTTSEDWIEAARKLIANNNYSDARKKLSHVSDDNERKKSLLLSCNISEAIEQHKYEKALKLQLLENEIKISTLENTMNKCSNLEFELQTLVRNYIHPHIDNIQEVELINKIYKDESQKKSLMIKFIKRYTKYIDDYAMNENNFIYFK